VLLLTFGQAGLRRCPPLLRHRSILQRVVPSSAHESQR
jgi:hypothetical protein